MSSSIVSEKSQDDPHRATEKRVGRISAVILPLLELGAVGFVTYMFTYLLCAQYLISPSPKFQRLGISPRNGIGIALITLFSVTLFMFLVCWARMTVAIYRNPGTLPLGASDVEKVATSARYLDKYSAYTCDHEGLPKWCKKCQNYKPDRVHHCKELDRCVRRMDHFCPWAGGIISEGSHKFFVQFLFYGMIWTGYVLIPTAYFLAERIRIVGDKPAEWIAGVALSALFCMFTGGMFGTTMHQLAKNMTTVEVVQQGGCEYIAMLATRGHSLDRRRSSRTSTAREPDISHVLMEFSRDDGREYVVFRTEPFENPWNLGVARNVRSVMGEGVLDWFFPFRTSPCQKHDDSAGEFAWAPFVLRMARDWEAANPGRRIQLLRDGRRRRSHSVRSHSAR